MNGYLLLTIVSKYSIFNIGLVGIFFWGGEGEEVEEIINLISIKKYRFRIGYSLTGNRTLGLLITNEVLYR